LVDDALAVEFVLLRHLADGAVAVVAVVEVTLEVVVVNEQVDVAVLIEIDRVRAAARRAVGDEAARPGPVAEGSVALVVKDRDHEDVEAAVVVEIPPRAAAVVEAGRSKR